MSDERKYYCICEDNCKFETMTKEQILAAIAQAMETGSVGNCDTGFITKVKEQNGGSCVTFWVGTQAQYNAIETKEQNCMYIITDDTTAADILKACKTATDEATAASEAAAAANAAAAAALQKIDENGTIVFTHDVDFTWDTEWAAETEITEADLVKYYFGYNKYTGLAHFVVRVQYDGAIKKGQSIAFKASNNKYPLWEYLNYVPVCTDGDFTCYIYGNSDGTTELVVVATEDKPATEYGGSVCCSGWYLVGENNGAG